LNIGGIVNPEVDKYFYTIIKVWNDATFIGTQISSNNFKTISATVNEVTAVII
jgi:hypothetical protein